MKGSLEGLLPEQARSFDFSAYGRLALLDRDGGRLRVSTDEGGPQEVPGVSGGVRCRWRGGDLMLLSDDDRLLTVAVDGELLASESVHPGARDLAVSTEGNSMVAYGGRTLERGHAVLERLGRTPGQFATDDLSEACALAPATGGVWVGGTGPSRPAARILYLRPRAQRFEVRLTILLPAPPRSAVIGPDGALFVLLEPGESMARIWHDEVERPQRLPAPLVEIHRRERQLWGVGPRGFVDLTRFVPAP